MEGMFAPCLYGSSQRIQLFWWNLLAEISSWRTKYNFMARDFSLHPWFLDTHRLSRYHNWPTCMCIKNHHACMDGMFARDKDILMESAGWNIILENQIHFHGSGIFFEDILYLCGTLTGSWLITTFEVLSSSCSLVVCLFVLFVSLIVCFC